MKKLLLILIGLGALVTHVEAQQTSVDFKSLGLKFISVPAGEYRRGFEDVDRRENAFHQAHPFSNAQNFNFERPDHKVVLTKGFEMSDSEVTVGQFKAFVEATGFRTDAERIEGALGFFSESKDYVDRFRKDATITWRSPGFKQSDKHPVVAISRNDALAFCSWIKKLDGKDYRLPTEAEWEYACRAGTKTWYSWGTNPDQAYNHANVADGSLESAHPQTTRYQRAIGLNKSSGDGAVYTAKVKSYKPNPWGLYDMHGNVWEWCEDRWSEDVYKRYFDGLEYRERLKFEIRDPLFLKKTDQHKYGDWRVIRGGAWTCAPAATRSSIRTFAAGDEGAVYIGFRVVRSKP